MSNPVYTRRPAETLGSDALAELALDLRWSFNHAADTIWQQLDPVLWNLTHNPWFVLQTVSRERLDAVTADREFQQLVDGLVREKRHAEESPAWFQQVHPHATLSAVAPFSMEFMLSEALPIYSGGLGNVAGDQLKTASNLGVPVVGIGLLYQQGYFRQEFDARGRQQALYPFNDPGQLPVRHVDLGELDPEGVRVELYAEGADGGTPVRQPLGRREHLAGSTTRYVYAGEVPTSRPSSDFTPRLMPFHAGASVPLEAPFILWYAPSQSR